VASALVATAAVLAVPAAAQTAAFFKCTDAAGNVQFTDKACHGAGTAEPVVPAGNSALPERKAQNDARIARDRQSASRMEAGREAEAAAGRAAQDRQLQVTRQIAERLSREQAARNAAAVSVLPPTQCNLCAPSPVTTPPISSPPIVNPPIASPPIINPPMTSPSTDFGSAFSH
jgi:hypothetical protein